MSSSLSSHEAGRLTSVLRWVYMSHLTDFMIIMPLGPQLLRGLDIPLSALGELVFVYTLFAGIAGLGIGLSIHRFPRRQLLLAVYGGFALALLLTCSASSYGMLLLARALAGTCGGVLSALVQATVVDYVTVEARAAALGKLMTGHALASVVGVPLSLSIAAQTNWRLPFALLLVLTLVLAWLVRSRIPATRPAGVELGGNGFRPGALLGFVPAFSLTFAVSASAYAIAAYFAPYWTGNVGVTESELALVFLASGALSLYTSPLIGRLADRHGRLRVFAFASLFSLVLLALVSRSGPLPLVMAVPLGAVFFITIYGRWIPALALLSEWPHPSRRSGFMMVNGVVTQLSMGVGAWVAGEMIGFDSAGRISGFAAVGNVAIVVSLLALLIAVLLARKIASRTV